MEDDSVTIIHGDCLEKMKSLPDNSVDSIVTDPPYGLKFLNKDWDHEVPGEAYWRECLRVAKPGAHLVAFGGPNKYHRLTCAIEDAGWEIRDCFSYLFGSGFPHGLDISKAIDKKLGAEREVIGSKIELGRYPAPPSPSRNVYGKYLNPDKAVEVTAPATELAAKWDGWNTSMKPGWEPIILARKPLAGSVTANVIVYGTGGLNIGRTRLESEPVPINKLESWSGFGQKVRPDYTPTINLKGRWPTNVILDEESAKMLDEQTGTSGEEAKSRFFYTAKASKKERQGSSHPTVKPVSLMRWLCTLVTPVNGVILDPFAGTGTTGEAGLLEGFRVILIEMSDEYVEDIKTRIASTIEEMNQEMNMEKP